MKWHLIGLTVVSLAFCVTEAEAQTPSAATTALTVAAADAQVRAFLNNLQAGKNAEAVDGLLAASTTPPQKPDERGNLLGQVDAAVATYGPVVGFEKVATDTLGTMVVREHFLVQHRDMVVRWEFVLVRSGTGWHVDYFGFDDQPRGWF